MIRSAAPLSGRPVAHADDPGLNRQILSLAVPALGALVAEPLFVLIDSAMVGHLGATSLAGLSLASTVLTTIVGLFVFLAYATTATTARLFGAGDRRGGLRAGIDGAWLAALLGLGAAAARAYLRASAPGIPGMLIVYAATGTLRGLLDTRTPFVVAGVGAVLNAGLNAVLLYGIGMGIAGSGLGTAITQSTMAAVLMTPVVRAARGAGVGLRPRCRGLRTSLGAGAPLLVRTLSLRAAILTTVWSATAIGEVALAAHQVVTSLWTFAAFALDALAIAAQALVGNALGRADASRAADDVVGAPDRSDDAAGGADSAGGAIIRHQADGAGPDGGVGARRDDARPALNAVLRRCLMWGVAVGAVIGIVLATASPWLPRMFSSQTDVVATATRALVVAASAMPLAGAVYLFDGVLMGAGDGRYLAGAGLVTLVPYLPLAVAVAQGWPSEGAEGLVWLWGAFAWVFMGARALTTGLRARGDTWRG